jgi:hypothetical protein
MTQAELKATWTFTRLTRELFSGDAGDGRPVLEFSIRAEALAAFEEPEPPDFVDACLESQTPWDEFIRSLEPGLPELLPDLLISVLRERRFREFWHRMCERLSSTQRDELVSWYEVMARFRREQYDLRPNCMSGS